jgi:hypothetical protein
MEENRREERKEEESGKLPVTGKRVRERNRMLYNENYYIEKYGGNGMFI